MINKNIQFKPLGIYIHVPFCLSKCNYCGFYSKGLDEESADYEKYCAQIIEDIQEYGKVYGKNIPYQVDTVFFGGGTPSLLSGKQIKNLLKALENEFFFHGEPEITIESNPKTLTMEKLKEYRQAGVNRLSIGCQSFDNEILEFLGRSHKAEDIEETFNMARLAGFDNINLDFIFGIPGQTEGIWLDTLKNAVLLEPEHLSLYGLQLEENTEFFRWFQKGKFTEMSEAEDRKLYKTTMDFLESTPYKEHYEISNWAKEGFSCKHNLKYWNLEDYLGLGEGSASYMNHVRFAEFPSMEYHENTLRDDGIEYAFTSLRCQDGISFNRFKEITGESFWDFFDGEEIYQIKEFIGNGFLIETSENLQLTKKGIDISNKIMAIFV